MSTKKQLALRQISTGTDANIYSTPVGTTTILKEITACNPTTTDAYFSLAIVDSQGITATNFAFYKVVIQAGSTVILSLSSVVPEGKTVHIVVQAVTGPSKLNIIASGVELVASSAKQLIVGMIPKTASTALYTTPVGKDGVLYQVLVTNVAAVSDSVTLYIVPPAGTVSTANMVLNNIAVQPNATLLYSAATALPAGTKIYATSNSINTLNLTIDGTEK